MEPPHPDAVRTTVRRLRTVVLALALGLAAILVVAALVAPLGGDGLARRSGTFVIVAYALAFAHGIGFALMRRAIVGRTAGLARGDDPPHRTARLQAYQVLVIVRAALIEGAALVGVVFHALTGGFLLVPIPLAGIGLLLVGQPSVERFAAFVAEARRSR